MKNVATLIGALVLAAGAAQATGLNETNGHNDVPKAPVTAQNPVQVKAGQVLSGKELARLGLPADAELTVSDFSAPGPRSTYTR
ncbi:hypothetical protein GIY56_01415 [Paracoccus sp. YIM 132242]|uniref:Uncharacterized protein n=1 Tax=Paracoccus lichenicola TaxID=2665644 RepID=A0A6L6HLB6_9RHOB|nr:hypothetical protein [Paracoccus lichenicola]MTD98942.1 hypothetical protein [Paracoccus lichenicola]